jgi:hypothetical protein
MSNAQTIGIMQPENAVAIVKGSSRTYEIRVQDEHCEPVNLTGCTMYFTVKEHLNDVAPYIQKTSLNALEIEFVDALGGVARVYVNPSDTFHARVKPYCFDVWLILTTGKRYVIIPPSIFDIQAAVTVIPV